MDHLKNSENTKYDKQPVGGSYFKEELIVCVCKCMCDIVHGGERERRKGGNEDKHKILDI